MKAIFTLFSIPFFVLNVSAQKIYNLEQCIDYAYQHNIQIKQAENSIQISEITTVQNKMAFFPSLNASASHNYNYGRNIDPFTNQFTNSEVQSNQFGINATWIIFAGLQAHNNFGQSKMESKAAEEQLKNVKYDLALNVANAFLNCVLQKKLCENLNQQIQLSEESIRRSEQLIKAGTVAETVLTEQQTQYTSEKIQLEQGLNRYTISLLQLQFWMNYIEKDTMQIDMSIADMSSNNMINDDINTIVEKVLNNHPQLKAGNYRKLANMRAYSSAKGRMYPRLLFNANFSTLYSSSALDRLNYTITGYENSGYVVSGSNQAVLKPIIEVQSEKKAFGRQLEDNFTRFFGFSLQIPIFNNLQVSSTIKRAKIQVQNTELDIEQNKLSIGNTVRRTYEEMLAAKKIKELALQMTSLSEQSYKNMKQRMEAGIATPFDVNQTKTRHTLAQNDLVRYELDYLFKLKVLQLYIGQ